MKFDHKKWNGYADFCIGGIVGSLVMFAINPGAWSAGQGILFALAGAISFGRLLRNSVIQL